MGPTLFTASAGSGKTHYIIEQIRVQGQENQLPRILVILASGTQLIAFRQRIARATITTFGVTLTDFHTLYRDILDAAGRLPRVIPETARYRIVRAIIRGPATANQLSYFAPIAEKPGFIAAVSDLIAELKDGLTQPEKFAQLASTPRCRDLAAIYSAYQALLSECALVDREGLGWLALEALQSDPRLFADFDYVAADGFDEFDQTQLALLNLLATRVSRLDVALTYQSDRLAHIRFARTLAQLKNAARVELASSAPPRSAPLDHLERYLFELDAPHVSAGDAVRFISAPDRTREVRAIAREVKRLLVGGARPEQIGVLFRRLDGYHALSREVFSEFDIPFRIREGMSLDSNPLIAALLNVLTLSVNGFPWRDTLDALRSTYIAPREPGEDDLAQIEEITREAVVVKGRDAWLAAFIKPTAPLREDEEDARLVMRLSQAEIGVLRAKVDTFLSRVAPPERGSPRDLISWIEALIGADPRAEEWQRQHFPEQFEDDTNSLRIIERARASDPLSAEIAARDVCALVELKNVLRGIVQAAEILADAETKWSDFVGDLVDAVRAATYDLTPTAEGRVMISTISQGRGVPKDYVFLGGLVESEFPLRAQEDPLLTASERDMLLSAGVRLRSLQSRDEATLFYEAVTLARRTLFVSYPTFDDDANPLYPSPYIQSVRQILDNIPQENLSLNYVPAPIESASLTELAVSLAISNARGGATTAALDHALQRASPGWTHSLFARQVEARRESTAPHDEFSGVMGDASLRAEFAVKFGGDHLWSAYQFNEWGACGFRFFAKRLLNLKEIPDPEEGLDDLQLGALYHEILEQAYRQFAERSIVVTEATLSNAQKIMAQTAERILEVAPTRFAFRPTAWWSEERGEILRRLNALLEAEAERNGNNPPTPSAFEVPFGFGGKPALRVKLPIGSIRVIGKIDRIDRRVDGSVVLVDYKSGSTPIGPGEVIQGRNLQLPIYVLAAEGQGDRVEDAFFFHIRGGQTSGNLARVDRAGWLGSAMEHMNRYVNLARAGEFAVEPNQIENGSCNAYCEFASLCRVGRWSVKDKTHPSVQNAKTE